ncbi:MAG: ABC transporter ATP-binding protein [Eubacteriales bacterium]|nr:ABC transporter ATP-binding protein [Eubacteriales bacterium]
MENKNAFEVRNLSFAYGEKQIVKNLSFDVPRGKVVTLMGANGCGKSTLFQLLTKNLTPGAGSIRMNGEEISRIGLKSFAQQAAIVHQYNTAPSDITVEQLVAYGRTPFYRFGQGRRTEEDERMIERALRITRVDAFRDRAVHQLSGGQKQRVWIAMALAQGTRTLLLDEPTTYLDVRYQIQLLRLIRALNQKYRTTILMVLHDINQAVSYSDEIIALSPKGELVAQGEPRSIINEANLKKMYRIDLETKDWDGRRFVLTV